MNIERARSVIAVQYAEAEQRLQGTPEWVQLCADADREARETPDKWFARNLKALHLEMHTPMFPRTKEGTP